MMASINDFIIKNFTPDNIMILLVLFLVVLAAIVICLIRAGVKETSQTSVKQIKKDLEKEEIIRKLEPKEKLNKIDEYEKEQEQKAIISYEELLKNASKLQIDYEDDEDIADIVIHKVNLSENKESKPLEKVKEKINQSFYPTLQNLRLFSEISVY